MVAVALLSRVALRTYPVGVLLLAVQATDSHAHAGWVSGAAAIGDATAVPWQGRRVDLFGPRRSTVVLAPTNPGCFVTLVVALGGPAAGPAPVLVAFASGATLLRVAPEQRAPWSEVVPAPETRRAALAVDAATLDLALVGGPLSAAAIAAAAGSATTVPGGAVLVLRAASWFLALLATRDAEGRRRADRARRYPAPGGDVPGAGARRRRRPRGVLAALAASPCPLVLAVAVVDGGVLGALRVAFAVFGRRHTMSGVLGLAVASFGVGGVRGGPWSGGRCAGATPARAIPLLLTGYTAATLLLAVDEGPVTPVALAATAGWWSGPVVVHTLDLVARHARAGAGTEAVARGITATFTGAAAGNALGGLAASSGYQPAVLAAASSGGLAALLALACRGRLAVVDGEISAAGSTTPPSSAGRGRAGDPPGRHRGRPGRTRRTRSNAH